MQTLINFSSSHEKNAVMKRSDLKLKITMKESQLKKMHDSKKSKSSSTFNQEANLSEDSLRFLEKSNEIRIKEEEENNLKVKYQHLQNKLETNKQQLIQIDEEIKKEKRILKFHLEMRANFYLDLLKNGQDCGLDEGITWIIRKIQKLGIAQKNIVFPSFLDEKAKEFLMEVS